jgi:UDP-N-acetylmuramyl-tripeptide synthetase
MAASTLLQHRSADAAVAWLRAHGATGLATDSRRVKPGDAFIAWPGYGTDGRQFVPAALKAGAAVCLVEAEGAEGFAFDGERVASLHELKSATGEIAARFFDRPSESLHVVATTGTNGKTSTAWWVAQALSLLGQRCGVVGTLGVGEPPSSASPNAQVVSTGLTTPDPVTLQRAFRHFADEGFSTCAIEASSIGIVEHRLAGTRIEVALFTNFTRDHLDFHGDMAAYWDAKAQLFTWPGLRAAVVNVDDEHGATLADGIDSAIDLWTCGTTRPARLRAEGIGYRDGGLAFTLHEGGESVSVDSRLIGDYNVSNLLVVIGGLRALGVSLHDAARVCPKLTAVPGRMQRVDSPDSRVTAIPAVVVDYAHTPDALDKALAALRPFASERQGQLWAVFGCGGNRDATKRPLMGEIAERQADQVVVTSDNPRFEKPADILRDIVSGMKKPADANVVVERRAAIAQAVMAADVRDVLLIAGKGHEAEQEIAGVKLPFSDVAEARKALARRVAT